MALCFWAYNRMVTQKVLQQAYTHMLRSVRIYILVKIFCDRHTPVCSEAYGFMPLYQDVDNINDLEKEEAQVEDGDSVDIYDIWDITIEDVKRIRKFFTPNVPDVMDDVIQPLILKTIHTTPADKDYVAPVTK
nr:hypothetical protein [Tanacetum cinerariifolium]